MKSGEKVKSIQLSVSTWKKLSQIKMDLNKPNFDSVVKELIEDKGY